MSYDSTYTNLKLYFEKSFVKFFGNKREYLLTVPKYYDKLDFFRDLVAKASIELITIDTDIDISNVMEILQVLPIDRIVYYNISHIYKVFACNIIVFITYKNPIEKSEFYNLMDFVISAMKFHKTNKIIIRCWNMKICDIESLTNDIQQYLHEQFFIKVEWTLFQITDIGIKLINEI